MDESLDLMTRFMTLPFSYAKKRWLMSDSDSRVMSHLHSKIDPKNDSSQLKKLPVCWLVTRVMTLTPPFTKYGKYVFEKWILNWCMWKFVPLMKQLLSLRVMWSDVTSTGKRHFRFDHCSIYDMIRDSKRSHIITPLSRRWRSARTW